MSFLKGVGAIGVATVAGVGAAVPGSYAGLIVALAFLRGPFSNEVVMVLPFLAGFAGAIVGLPCGAIGWFSCSSTGLCGLRGWLLSVPIAAVVAASGTAVLYWLLIAPDATVPGHSVLILGIALTIGVGGSGGICAIVCRAFACRVCDDQSK